MQNMDDEQENKKIELRLCELYFDPLSHYKQIYKAK